MNERLEEKDPSSMAGIGTHERVLELVREFLPGKSRVVDLAAGEGAFSRRLLALGHDVVAVDFSRENWRATDIPLSTHDLDSEFAAEIAKDHNKFDAIVAIEIIEHLENPFRFIRECAKILKPHGRLFLTTPNVEAVNSRLIFLYSGRMASFGEYETVRPAHITPIFAWKLRMMLEEADFETIYHGFNRTNYTTGVNIKGRVAAIIGRMIEPFVKGQTGGESRMIVARQIRS